jgi:hypothetical protein
MSGAVGAIDGKPLFIAAIRRCDVRPRSSAVERSPQIGEKVLDKAEIKKAAEFIGV